MTKFTNTFIPARFDLVVTRHAGLVEWLIREGYIDESTPIVNHAHANRPAQVIDWEGYEHDPSGPVPMGVDVIGGGRVLASVEVPSNLDGIEERLHAQREIRASLKPVAAAYDNANVKDKHVLGVLPHHLSSKAASITEVQLDIPASKRGAELTASDVGEYARGLHTYVVRRAEAQHMHSAAVEAAWRYVEKHGTSFGAGPGIVQWADCQPVRGLPVTMIGSGCTQAHAHIIMSRGLWRGQSKGPWLDGLGREVMLDDIEPAAGWKG